MKTLTNRSRTKSFPDSRPTVRFSYTDANTPPVEFSFEPNWSPIFYKSIDDWHGKVKSARGIFPTSDTVQFSFDASALRPLESWNFLNGSIVARINIHNNSLPVETNPSVVFNFPVVSDESWKVFAANAFNSFATQIPTEVGLANFTWELRELSALIPKLDRTLQGSVSGGYLNFSFGWKPFVSDLQKLGGILNTVSAKIQHLRDTYGKKTRLGLFQANVVEPPSHLVQDVVLGSGAVLRWTLHGYRSDLRAGGYLFHQLRGLYDTYGYIRALLVAVGLDNPVKAIWQAIPYSFVADWFTGFGPHLDRLSINPFKGQWEVSDFTSSNLTVAKWRVDQVVDSTSEVYPLGFVDARKYTRISRLPVPSAFEGLTVPSPQQLLLFDAMLAQH